MHRLTQLVASECESNENTLGLRLSPDVSEEFLYIVEIILFEASIPRGAYEPQRTLGF